ncbi:hypothetical protein C7212DRAFT_292732 [Tuber magnatum]|uniref:Uncharacterized protein n=1 Tax=Tuber magnatum TaxID=42249 RepID=A0A317STQ7_9PEZI|nr:hypothetical protein C7212DRAFT_292732 [Tuber magnatum]
MGDNRAHLMGGFATPSGSQTPVPNMSLNMDYYLNEGLEGVERQQYRDARTFTRAIQGQADELRSGNLSAGQYAIFAPVTQDQLTNLERIRDACHKSLRFLYLNEAETLIVKIMPGLAHELATREFADTVKEKIRVMGLRREVGDAGGTTYRTAQSAKEADSALKPDARSLEMDWPTVVYECGVSESLRRLRIDSSWWLANSSHDVKIVLLISVNKPQQRIHLEQWEDRTIPNPYITRNNPNPLITRPMKINEINIYGNTVTGAPLRLDFRKVFLRPPAPGEGDILLIAQDLQDYAKDVWRRLQ